MPNLPQRASQEDLLQIEAATPEKLVAATAATWSANLVALEAMPAIIQGLVADATSQDVVVRMEARRDLLRYAQSVQNLVLYHRQQKSLDSITRSLDGPTLQLLLKLVEQVKAGKPIIDVAVEPRGGGSPPSP